MWSQWSTSVLVTDPSSTFPPSDKDRTFERIIGLGALIGALAMTIAGATIWLLLTDPVSVTSAVDRRDVGPLLLRLARAIYNAMAGILEYL
jgi:hypothetical protein